MGENLYVIDIIIFGMIAAFLVFRLRNVLGRRTGHQEERRTPYADDNRSPAEKAQNAKGDNVVTLPERHGARSQDLAVAVASEEVAQGVTQIKIADPSFDEAEFLQGAEMAFGMIVDAFANGDTGALRPLLSDDLYDDFSSAIRSRIAQGHTLETRVELMKSVEISDARMEGRTAFVTIKYVTDQINVTRDDDGLVVEGDPEAPSEVIDLWTFARNTRSDDPNWLLVQTQVPDDGEDETDDAAEAETTVSQQDGGDDVRSGADDAPRADDTQGNAEDGNDSKPTRPGGD